MILLFKLSKKNPIRIEKKNKITKKLIMQTNYLVLVARLGHLMLQRFKSFVF